MALDRSEKKMVLNVNPHKELVQHAHQSALPFFARKVPVETMISCLGLSNDIKMLNALNNTNKKANEAFHSILKSKQLLSQQLLEHVAHGNQEEAEKIIALDPGLLMIRGTAKTYAEDTIKDVNPVELAWGEEDDAMFMMMQPYVKKLPREYQRNLLTQLKERFSENKKMETYDFKPIVTAISRHDEEAITAAIDHFRNYFAPRIIGKEDGKYLNRITTALTLAMQIYINLTSSTHWYIPSRWGLNESEIFWTKVIGYLQRRLSACYAQSHCQGLYDVIEQKLPLHRDLKLEDGSLYFANPLDSKCGLGFDFAVISFHRAYMSKTDGVWLSAGGYENFITFMSRKQSSLSKAYETLQQSLEGNELIASRNSP